MCLPKKGIALAALLLTINFMITHSPVALADTLPATGGNITVHEPQGRTSVEIEAPQTGGGSWLWAILGVAIVGGIAAAAGGGGGGGGGDDDDDDPTGSFETSW